MNLKDNLTGEYVYKLNQYQIQKYTENYHKLIYFKKPFRTSGYELETDKNKAQKGTANDEKLDNNIRRSKSTIFELALCNEWDYFVTFTINEKKYARNNLKLYYKAFSKWLNNYNFRNKLNIKYLFIPELHNDGQNWHIHGLMRGVPKDSLFKFKEGIHPKKLVKSSYRNWEEYEKKFGFCSFDIIKSHERVSSYITKYITKELDKCVKELNAKFYYCSLGLKRKEIIKKGNIIDDYEISPTFDYENEYIAIKIINKL